MHPSAHALHDRVMSALAGHDVRVLFHDHEPWFPVNDLVAALGVSRRTLDHHVGHLPDEERRYLPRPVRLPRDIVVGNPGLNCVSLTGLLKLLLLTTGPAAAGFQTWVCQHVLLPLWNDAEPR